MHSIKLYKDTGMNAFNLETIKQDFRISNTLCLKLSGDIQKLGCEIEIAKLQLSFINHKSVKNILNAYYEHCNNFLTRQCFAEFYNLSLSEVNQMFDLAKQLDETKYTIGNKTFIVNNVGYYLVKIANQFLLTRNKINSLLIDCIVV